MNFDERIRVHILYNRVSNYLKKISVMPSWSGRKFDKIFLSFAYVYLYLYLDDILKEIIIIELFP